MKSNAGQIHANDGENDPRFEVQCEAQRPGEIPPAQA